MILFHLADSMSVWNLLREFRIRQVHMAVVLNEYGGTIGVCPYETHFFILYKLDTV
jgi:CBS domain containing-hemolysin-like protein